MAALDTLRFRIERDVPPKVLVAVAAARLAEEARVLKQKGWRTARRTPASFRVVRPVQRARPKGVLSNLGWGMARMLEWFIEDVLGALMGGRSSRLVLGKIDQVFFGVDTGKQYQEQLTRRAAYYRGLEDHRLDQMMAQGQLEYIGVAALRSDTERSAFSTGAQEQAGATVLLIEASGPNAAALAQRLQAFLERAGEGQLRQLARSGPDEHDGRR